MDSNVGRGGGAIGVVGWGRLTSNGLRPYLMSSYRRDGTTTLSDSEVEECRPEVTSLGMKNDPVGLF